MIEYHNLNGVIVKANEAQIFVNDVGLLRGYGIFDFFPVANFIPLFEQDYFDRFYGSAALMNLEVPVSRQELHDRVVELAHKNQMSKGYAKLVLTGGYAIDGYTPSKSNLYILQHPDYLKDPMVYDQGVTLLLQRYLKDQPRIKTLHYANALKNRDALANANAMDLLYHDGRFIRETSRANFFLIDEDGIIHTTEANVLSGITRKHVIKLAKREGMTVVEAPLPIAKIISAQECFITSTTKGVLSVSKINDYSIGTGQAGQISLLLQDLFLKYCEEQSA
ncbi:MAG: aminotransferase class IV family protein [Saprospiraceae bacterium]|nr:aminotransferase class IV family protein [Saprospiraceae bacterium]